MLFIILILILIVLCYCCIELHKELDGKTDVVEFDFLGKDSIRYYNRVQVCLMDRYIDKWMDGY